MAAICPLPRAIRDKLHANTHPGLLLDKYIESWDPDAPPGNLSARVQKPALQALVTLAHHAPAGFDFAWLHCRRAEMLRTMAATTFSCTTAGPLTLHLARASALENAGICLHPLYGFVYLPGTGLKGMARAYAETVWLPTQYRTNQQGQPADETEQGKAAAAWQTIERVFGWAPHSDDGKVGWKPANIPGHKTDDSAASGSIVFHEAWPETWPKLELDIVNNHHTKYYQGSDSRDAPGDWESPIMVSFLAVGPGQTFCFALSKRRTDAADELLERAREWLLGALVHEGAGAKTAAGYGAFKPCEGAPPKLASPSREVFETTLELVTPAFLAGANQEAGDCQLRTATLRGLLRWWWRTMHAGFVDVATLRRLEAAIWGDTDSGGAVRIDLGPMRPGQPERYDKKAKANMGPQEKASEYGIPGCDPRKTTQGLWYGSFGMDETSRGQRRQRCFLEPGAAWTVRLIARGARFFPNPEDARNPKKRDEGISIPAEEVCRQAKSALWLLCTYGAVGSKCRKGFGSLSAGELRDWNLDNCRQVASILRKRLQLSTEFDERNLASSALGNMLDEVVEDFAWPNVWDVLDQVGFAWQSISKNYRHRLEKLALGLPRKIGPPALGRFDPTGPVRALLDEARRQRKESNLRHASTVHIHLSKLPGGQLRVCAVAFPAAYLPDLQTSTQFLRQFMAGFAEDLRRRAHLPPPRPTGFRAQPLRGGGRTATSHDARQPPAAVSDRSATSPPAARPAVPKSGDLVEAVLVEDPKGKGRRFARHVPSGLVGPILNADQIPPDKNVGDALTLAVASISGDGKQIQFRVPTDADRRPKAGPRGGPPGGPFRRR